MNSIAQELLEMIRTDTSANMMTSHWKKFYHETKVDFSRGVGVLQGRGFGDLFDGRLKPLKKILHTIERLTYYPVSSRLRSYPRIWKMTKKISKKLSIDLTYDVWKYAMAVSILIDHFERYKLKPKTFALIGDGYGVLGILLRLYMPAIRIYSIDLPKMLIFQSKFYEITMDNPNENSTLLTQTNPEPKDLNFVIPENIQLITEKIDCAININSMQEMTYECIQYYFSFLRGRSHKCSRFYCVNRIHNQLIGGEIVEFEKYPWSSKDEAFIDEICPYLMHFFSFSRAKNAYGQPTLGPKFLGKRIPIVNYFDGVARHKLVRLSLYE